MELLRLRGRKTSERLRSKGRVWKGKTMVIRWLSGAPRAERDAGRKPRASAFYIGSFASAKLHKSAVKRNRMRRRCREALRTAAKDATGYETFQLLLTPRSASLTCDFRDIQKDVEEFLSVLKRG